MREKKKRDLNLAAIPNLRLARYSELLFVSSKRILKELISGKVTLIFFFVINMGLFDISGIVLE